MMGTLTNYSPTGVPIIIVDAQDVSYIDSSIYRYKSNYGTRQAVAMTDLRYSLINYTQYYLIRDRVFVPSISVPKSKQNISKSIVLKNNYPNPFNSSTRIEYLIPEDCHVIIKIYNSLGQELEILFMGSQAAGKYIMDWNAKNLPSGIYYCNIVLAPKNQKQSDCINLTKKIVFIK
jgi:hypothetical protein